MLKKYDRLLYEALVEKGLVSKKTLDALIKEIDASGGNLQQILIARGVLPEEDMLNALADKLKVRYLNLQKSLINKAVLEKVPVKIASYYKFLPIKIKGRTLTIAAYYPLDIKTQDEIRTQLGYDIELVLSCSRDITDGLNRYYGTAAETLESIDSQQGFKSEESAQEISQERVEDIEKLAEDASVIKLVNQIILEGWRKRATDIHIEPYRGKVYFRYRIDGVLYDANVPQGIKGFLNAIISRIKIMSNLNIVERRLPQDGRAVVRVQEQVLDLRISTIPTPFGESVVIRILPTQMLFGLERLGLSGIDQQIFERLVMKPHGIIFVTGPTGSGKTTTLYACLSKINTKERKIITIEDPIEYEITGITQMQVMPEIGLDFARGLRSILRHDPDVIMVGEVRDSETAEIAIRVALTGHLIFSTLHTNDAASAIARLVDIGVEPYLVASSVEAFIAQRLIRLICPKCKYEDTKIPEELKEPIAKDLGLRAEEFKIFRGKGCPDCNLTGFFGRTAIYEILLVDEKIKDLILKKVPSNRIREAAISQGMRILRRDGWQKVIAGLTTPEEVMQVTPAEELTDIGKPKQVFVPSDVPDERPARALDLGRRTYARVSKKINLRYKVYKSREELLKGGSKSEQLSVTENISAGGLLFFSNKPLPFDAILDLKIEMPDNEDPIGCLAKVVRIEEAERDMSYNIAVCFLDMASVQKVRISKYVEKHAKSE
ncbi:MAG: Flp pilus assembly complex ATPase component TadA [Candidatus Omnitrophica bacterium]|nr:Flp pilus assembly complex ATPase component TadA [Candidatus Omnitrophota bacterium]